MSSSLKKAVLERIGTVLEQKAFVPGVDFSNWPDVVRRHQKELDSASTATEFALKLDLNVLSEYRVSHLMVVPPETAIGKPHKSFGLEVVRQKDQFVVMKVYAGSRAEHEGLMAGMALNGYWFPNYPKYDRLNVSYLDRSGRQIVVSLPQEDLVEKVRSDLLWLDKDAFTLRVPSFSAGYEKKVVEKFIETAAEVPYLIVDLRWNSGGDPDYVDHLLGAFLKPGIRLGAAISKETMRDFSRKSGKPLSDRMAVVQWCPKEYSLEVSRLSHTYPGHIAVLVNESTASAGECAALALREFAGAEIFGTPSSGKVLFSNGANLPGGFQLQFPWRDYWSAKGTRLEGHPIIPDIESPPNSEEAGPLPTPLRLKALKWLREKFPVASQSN